MGADAAPQLVWAALILIFLVIVCARAFRKRRGRRPTLSLGPGTAGTIYDFLNEDKRKAIEIIVEEKAAARDPETADDTVNPPHADH